MGGFALSLVRTATPYAVGLLTALAARVGLDLPATVAADLAGITLVFLVGTGYYVGVRLLERKVPRLGALLGSSRAPRYDASSTASAPEGTS